MLEIIMLFYIVASSGDIIVENCNMQAPCTETNPANSHADDVDLCQFLCDQSEQCQSWMFNKDVSIILQYIVHTFLFHKHQLTLLATI